MTYDVFLANKLLFIIMGEVIKLVVICRVYLRPNYLLLSTSVPCITADESFSDCNVDLYSEEMSRDLSLKLYINDYTVC